MHSYSPCSLFPAEQTLGDNIICLLVLKLPSEIALLLYIEASVDYWLLGGSNSGFY